MRRVTNTRELNNVIPARNILSLRFEYVIVILVFQYSSMSEVALPLSRSYIAVTEDPCRNLLFAASETCAVVVLCFSSDSHRGR